MLDAVYGGGAALVPQVYLEDEVLGVDFRVVDFAAGGGVLDAEADAGRGGDWSSVLVAETTHARSIGLLRNDQSRCTRRVSNLSVGDVVARKVVG